MSDVFQFLKRLLILKSNIRLNLISNFVGRGWSSLLTLVFTPFFVKFLGVESYGLIGFYITLKAVVSFFDLGFSTTLNREVAIASAKKEDDRQIGDTSRTFEMLYWSIAGLLLICISVLSSIIARHWVNAESLSVDTVSGAVFLMGLVLTLRFPFTLYYGGLMGMQRQLLVNVINITAGTLRNVGALIVLWLLSPTIWAFFICQAVVAILETLLAMFFFWYLLNTKFLKARFRLAILMEKGKFAAGLTGIGFLTILLSQIDKIILIKLVPLKDFGYYSLALAIATGIQSIVVYPISNAVFPRFSQLIENLEQELKDFYHQACQLISVLIIPVGFSVVFFSFDVVAIWTRDVEIAEKTYRLLSLVMLGYILNSFTILPYMLQLASGWTKLTLFYNSASIIILVPILIVAVRLFGVMGAPIILILQNSIYILIVLYFMHRRILVKELKKWYVEDVGLPMITTVFVMLLFYFIQSFFGFTPYISIPLVMVLAFFIIILVSEKIRHLIMDNIRRVF